MNKNLDLMVSFAKAFERRYRDTKKPNRCLSIEGRYRGKTPAEARTKMVHDFSDDYFFAATRAWARVPCDLKQAVRLAFGFGAKSQADYEMALQKEIRTIGAERFNQLVDDGLLKWLAEIEIERGH